MGNTDKQKWQNNTANRQSRETTTRNNTLRNRKKEKKEVTGLERSEGAETEADATEDREGAGTEHNQRSKTQRWQQEEKVHIPDTLGQRIEEWMDKEGITIEMKGAKAPDEEEGAGHCLRRRTKQQQTRKEEDEEEAQHHIPDTLGRPIEKWIDGENITHQWKPRPRTIGTNKKDTTHNRSRHQEEKWQDQTSTRKSRAQQEETQKKHATEKQAPGRQPNSSDTGRKHNKNKCKKRSNQK